MEKRKMIIISGPTAVGKTDLSVKLAEHINGAVISADSVQVYKRLDIGSAKITDEEKKNIDHYLIDCLEPDERFDVSVFTKLAKQAAESIYSEGKIPIVVGGTAFYIQAFLKDVNFEEEQHDFTYRDELMSKSEDELYDMLCKIDNEYAVSVHKNNKKRVVRALEYNHYTGRKFSEYNAEQSSNESVYDYVYFVLNDERGKLYERIDRRVDRMIDDGLENEVRSLLDEGLSENMTSMQGIGYKEMTDFIRGRCSIEEAVDNIKTATRHFAKRQLTWFKREPDVIMINKQDFNYDEDAVLEYMLDKINEKIMKK